MVVLDAVHAIQAEQAPDLAVRWNCKAGKCGSCSSEINGKPRLMCMTRISDYQAGETITVTPMKAFPVIKDLVTDVSWNYEVNKRIPAFQPRAPDAPDGTWRMYQYEVERPQEFRKCIECFLCQDVSPRGRRDRVLQHHEVLYRGLSRVDHDHGQRHHPAQGAGGGRELRSPRGAVAETHQLVAPFPYRARMRPPRTRGSPWPARKPSSSPRRSTCRAGGSGNTRASSAA